VFEPKDGLRYGHKFWSDATTGLLLKARLVNDKGEVIAFYGEAALVETLAHQATRPVEIVYPEHPLAQSWPVGGAVQAKAVDLADAVDREIAALSSSGELTKIFASYGVSWRPPSQER